MGLTVKVAVIARAAGGVGCKDVGGTETDGLEFRDSVAGVAGFRFPVALGSRGFELESRSPDGATLSFLLLRGFLIVEVELLSLVAG